MVQILFRRGLQGLRILGFAACLAPLVTVGQEEKAAFDKKNAKDGGVGMPTPFDKFIALDQVLPEGKINWGQVFRAVAVDVDPDALNDKEIAIPMVLGIRIADGVMAIRARDAELLNKAASDIEKLAKKLGVTDGDLGRAREVRAAANKGEWLRVFMELGFFQQDIMNKIENKEQATRGTLLIVSGWLQGARYTSTVVADNYSAETSNYLREPLLARALKDKVEKLPANVTGSPLVTKLREMLPKMEKILDIPLEGSISKENVAELNRLCTEVVKAAMTASS